MAAATATNTIIKGLSHSQRGRDVTYQATWLVKCTAPVPGYVAQTLAQITTPNQMPIYGNVLKLISGEGFVTDVGDQYEDTSVAALDFNATEAIKGEQLNWHIVVGWRKPQPGEDAEQPDSVDQKPLSRPPRYRVEYRNSTEVITKGRLVKAFIPTVRPISLSISLKEDAVMFNTADDMYPPVEQDIIRPVLVISRNVKSPLVPLDINAKFENTTNKLPFTVKFLVGIKKFPLTITQYHARFLMAEVSEAQHEQSQSFVKQEVRIEISKTPYFLERRSEGASFLTEAKALGVRRYNDGTPMPGPYPLTADGTLAESPDKAHIEKYLTLGEEDYTLLL